MKELKLSKLWARSNDGLWVSAKIADEGIELFYQKRTNIIGNNVLEFDENGHIDRTCNVSSYEYGDCMNSVGTVDVSDIVYGINDVSFIVDTYNAIARHMVQMISLGYGNSASDILDLFSCCNSFSFASGVGYIFSSDISIKSCFSGLENKKCNIIFKDDYPAINIMIGSTSECLQIDSNVDKCWFLINTDVI